MDEQYQLIPEILSNNQKWKSKVIVVEKQSPKPSRQGNGRYQHLMLMDTQCNVIQASLYDSNITAFEDQLALGKTYAISKAYVKNNTGNYKYSTGPLQWTISGETRVEELNEDNLELVFSTYRLTSFHEVEQYMDTNTDLNILAVAVDMLPKRLIQSKDGSQSWVQDMILMDQNFKMMMLTLWDSFVDRECKLIAEIIDKKPVIFATNIKVTSFFGLKLSTKVRSTFFVNTAFIAVKELVEWVNRNSKEIDDLILKKSYMEKTPTKLSPPARTKFTSIQNLQNRLLPRKFYWVIGTATMEKIDNKCWYMACNNCYRRSNVDFGEKYLCIFCKNANSKAIPRARAYVQLSDTTGFINASAIGEPAEKLMFTDAKILMEQTNLDSDVNFGAVIQKMQDTERAFYVKATQTESNSTNYKFDIISVADLEPANITEEKQNEKFDYEKSVGKTTVVDVEEDWSPPAKKTLFRCPGDSSITKVDVDQNKDSSNPSTLKEKIE